MSEAAIQSFAGNFNFQNFKVLSPQEIFYKMSVNGLGRAGLVREQMNKGFKKNAQLFQEFLEWQAKECKPSHPVGASSGGSSGNAHYNGAQICMPAAAKKATSPIVQKKKKSARISLALGAADCRAK